MSAIYDPILGMLRSSDGASPSQPTIPVETMDATTVVQPGKVYRLVLGEDNSILLNDTELLYTLHAAHLEAEASAAKIYVSVYSGYVGRIAFGSMMPISSDIPQDDTMYVYACELFCIDIAWTQGRPYVAKIELCGVDMQNFCIYPVDLDYCNVIFRTGEDDYLEDYLDVVDELADDDIQALLPRLRVKDLTAGVEACIPIRVANNGYGYTEAQLMRPFRSDYDAEKDYYLNLGINDTNDVYAFVGYDNYQQDEEIEHTLEFSVEAGNVALDRWIPVDPVAVPIVYQSCFPAGSPVMVSLDGATKNIEDINSGETVVSYDVKTGEKYLTIVQENRRKSADKMARLTLADGTELVMQESHRVYTSEGWASITKHGGAKELVAGMDVMTASGWCRLASIDRWTEEQPIPVYTLALKDASEKIDDDTNDNFFVHGVMVHNAK